MVSDPPQNRANPRQPLNVSVDVEVEYSGAHSKGSSRNISVGGMMLETELKLKQGDRLRLRFSVPVQKEPVDTEAEVRWTEDKAVGVRFVGLRARDIWALGKLLNQGT